MITVFSGPNTVLANALCGGVVFLERAAQSEAVLSSRAEADSFHPALDLYRGNLDPNRLGARGPEVISWLANASESLRYYRSAHDFFPNTLRDPVVTLLQWLPFVPRGVHAEAVAQMKRGLALLLALDADSHARFPHIAT